MPSSYLILYFVTIVPFFQMFQVFHNCSADCCALKKLYGVDVNNYFDTQVCTISPLHIYVKLVNL